MQWIVWWTKATKKIDLRNWLPWWVHVLWSLTGSGQHEGQLTWRSGRTNIESYQLSRLTGLSSHLSSQIVFESYKSSNFSRRGANLIRARFLNVHSKSSASFMLGQKHCYFKSNVNLHLGLAKLHFIILFWFLYSSFFLSTWK